MDTEVLDLNEGIDADEDESEHSSADEGGFSIVASAKRPKGDWSNYYKRNADDDSEDYEAPNDGNDGSDDEEEKSKDSIKEEDEEDEQPQETTTKRKRKRNRGVPSHLKEIVAVSPSEAVKTLKKNSRNKVPQPPEAKDWHLPLYLTPYPSKHKEGRRKRKKKESHSKFELKFTANFEEGMCQMDECFLEDSTGVQISDFVARKFTPRKILRALCKNLWNSKFWGVLTNARRRSAYEHYVFRRNMRETGASALIVGRAIEILARTYLLLDYVHIWFDDGSEEQGLRLSQTSFKVATEKPNYPSGEPATDNNDTSTPKVSQSSHSSLSPRAPRATATTPTASITSKLSTPKKPVPTTPVTPYTPPPAASTPSTPFTPSFPQSSMDSAFILAKLLHDDKMRARVYRDPSLLFDLCCSLGIDKRPESDSPSPIMAPPPALTPQAPPQTPQPHTRPPSPTLTPAPTPAPQTPSSQPITSPTTPPPPTSAPNTPAVNTPITAITAATLNTPTTATATTFSTPTNTLTSNQQPTPEYKDNSVTDLGERPTSPKLNELNATSQPTRPAFPATPIYHVPIKPAPVTHRKTPPRTPEGEGENEEPSLNPTETDNKRRRREKKARKEQERKKHEEEVTERKERERRERQARQERKERKESSKTDSTKKHKPSNNPTTPTSPIPPPNPQLTPASTNPNPTPTTPAPAPTTPTPTATATTPTHASASASALTPATPVSAIIKPIKQEPLDDDEYFFLRYAVESINLGPNEEEKITFVATTKEGKRKHLHLTSAGISSFFPAGTAKYYLEEVRKFREGTGNSGYRAMMRQRKEG